MVFESIDASRFSLVWLSRRFFVRRFHCVCKLTAARPHGWPGLLNTAVILTLALLPADCLCPPRMYSTGDINIMLLFRGACQPKNSQNVKKITAIENFLEKKPSLACMMQASDLQHVAGSSPGYVLLSTENDESPAKNFSVQDRHRNPEFQPRTPVPKDVRFSADIRKSERWNRAFGIRSRLIRYFLDWLRDLPQLTGPHV